MNRYASFDLSTRDVYRVIFRHRKKAAAVFLGVMALVFVYALTAAKQYHSEAKLVIRLGRENTNLDATATIGQSPVVAVPDSREGDIDTVVEILGSRSLAERVVDTVGTEPFLGKQVDAKLDVKLREQVLETFDQHLSVERLRKSNVLLISYRAATPRQAQQVVEALVELYQVEHLRLNRTPGALSFLESETARVRGELLGQEQRLREMKQQTGLTSPDEQRRALVTRMARLQEELLTAEAGLAAGVPEARLMHKSLGDLKHIQVTGRNREQGNSAVEDVRRQLYNLQLREQTLLSRYTEHHVEVKQVRQEIAGAMALLQKQPQASKPVTAVRDKTMIEREPALLALAKRAEKLDSQLAATRSELLALGVNESVMRQLEREIQLLDTNYRKYSENLEQARIDQSLKTRRISNINVVQPASYNPRPVSPNKPVLLALGLIFATASSITFALLREVMDHSLKSPEEIEHKLSLPTLITIPHIDRTAFAFSGRN